MRTRLLAMSPFVAATTVAVLITLPSLLHGATPGVNLVASGDQGLTLDLSVPPPVIEEVAVEGRIYTRLKVHGWGTTIQAGSPELPVTGVLVQVPYSGGITAEVTEATYSSLADLLIYPVQPLKPPEQGQELTQPSIDESVYASQEALPGQIVEVKRLGVMRGVPVARVVFQPFQWNAATRELRCYQKITVKLHFEGSLPAQPAVVSALSTRDSTSSSTPDVYTQLLSRTLINYSGLLLQPYSPSTAVARTNGEALIDEQSGGLTITVKEDGIYRISYHDLKRCGINAERIKADRFRLFRGQQEVALRVGSIGRLRPWSYIEFYAKGMQTTFTDKNVYRLTWSGTDGGKHMDIRDGSVIGDGVEVDSFLSTVRAEENKTWWNAMPDAPSGDYWFWEKITAPATKTYSVALPSVVQSQSAATLRACFRGYSTASLHPNHHTRILVNGTLISDQTWDGTVEYKQDGEIPMSLLAQGPNTVTVALPGDTGAPVDSVYLNWLEVTYWRRFEAVGDELVFTIQGEGRFRMAVKNLSAPEVYVYDITDPYEVAAITGAQIQSEGNGYTVTFEDQISGERVYAVATQRAIKTPYSTKRWKPARLLDEANGADYLVITPKEFLPSVAPLLAFRKKQGLRVRAVAVEDIYDVFSGGIVDPQAIKDFLAYAYTNWERPAPTYVVLVGDANTDYRDHLGTGKKSWVPTHLSVTSQLGLTPDDNWYVAVEGDDVLPDVIIGRIPAANRTTARAMVMKVLRYETDVSYSPRQALFAADNNDLSFEAVAEHLIGLLGAGIAPQRVYLRSYGSVDQARQDLVGHIDRGMMFTTYVGHGDLTHWAGESFLVPEDIAGFANTDRLTFVVTLDCLNGYFAYPTLYSIGESLVMPDRTGAIAVFAPSGYGYTSEHDLLGQALLSSLFEDGNRLLGVITTGSKITAFSQGASEDLVTTFTLLGDPAVRLKGGN
jgi:hypothetical protein